MNRIKKLIVLVGNKDLKSQVVQKMIELKAVQAVSIYLPQAKQLAEILKLDEDLFVNPAKRNKPFPGGPVAATAKNLKRFATFLELGNLPVTFVTKPIFKTPAQTMDYFFETVAKVRWGTGWAVDKFFNDFAYLKSGVFVMTDADEHLEDLRRVNLDDELVVIGLEEENSKRKLDTKPGDGIDLVMQHTKEDEDASQLTMNLLQTVKNQFIKKGKNGRTQSVI